MLSMMYHTFFHMVQTLHATDSCTLFLGHEVVIAIGIALPKLGVILGCLLSRAMPDNSASNKYNTKLPLLLNAHMYDVAGDCIQAGPI